MRLDVSMLQSSQSLPALGAQRGAFAKAAASSSPDSPAKSVGGSSSKTGRLPSAKRTQLPQFHQTQYYSAKFENAYQDLANARNLRKLEVLFYEADTDGSGEMSVEEFREALRIPQVQRAFAVLGVQPHQSELVFKSLALRFDKPNFGSELSITEFMNGLQELVGTDINGSGKELDIETLRPAYRAKMKNESICQRRKGLTRATTAPGNKGLQKKPNIDLGPVHLLPKVKVQRAFVHSASANALHSATCIKKPLKLIFPF